MKTMMKYILLCCISLLCSVLYAADEPNFHFRRYDIENGLSSNCIVSLLQDSKGFIWIGTDKGLDRYDGTRIMTFNKKNMKERGLDNDEIMTLYQPSPHLLYIGTGGGVYIYEYATGQFNRLREKTERGITIQSSVSSIAQDKSGMFWISTRGQGVFAYSASTHKLVQYEMLDTQSYLSYLLVDKHDNVWIAGVNGTYKLNRSTNRFEKFMWKGKSIYSLYLYEEDTTGNIWIGTWREGLLKVEEGKITATYSGKTADDGSLTRIHSIQEYDSHRLLIGSDSGLTLLDTRSGNYRNFTDDTDYHTSLSDRFVYPILKDHEGGIWVGTHHGGINYIPPYNGQFETYTRFYPFEHSLPGKIVSHFQEDNRGNLWIAFENSGMGCFSPATGRFVPVQGSEKIRNWNIQSFSYDDNRIWLACYSKGFNVWDLRTGEIQRKGKNESIRDVFALMKDRKGTIWLGTTNSLYRYDEKTDELVFVHELGDLVRDMKEDAKGCLWIATNGKGVYRYNPQLGVWRNYGLKDGLPSGRTLNLCFDPKGQLWMGTSEGLCRYDATHDRFVTVPLDVPIRDICTIIADRGTLWLTTDKGLVKYVPATGEKYVFTRNDGLFCEVFCASSGLKTKAGKIFAGTDNGFCAFFPDKIHHNNIKPQVVLTGLEVFNKDLSELAGREGKTYPLLMEYMKKVDLKAEDNMVSFLYAALSYCAPEKNQYAYKLEGFDKAWNYVGTQSKATYTNLPPGTYTFRVKASNNDGVWNDVGASVQVVVHPPLYWSVPFKLLYLLIACGVTAWIVRYYIGRSRRKHRQEIELVKQEKDKEVQEAKINFFTMIAHEIRTPVSLIIAPLENVMKESNTLPTPIRDSLAIVNRNSQRLLYLVNQLLDFRKVQENEMKMRFAPQDMNELLTAVCDRFRPAMQQRNIAFRVQLPDRPLTADVDGEAITKLVSNLLSNANKYATDEVEVLCATTDGNRFFIRVGDNGKGITPEEQQKIFNPFFQGTDNKPGTGIGLSIVKGIAEAHGGQVEVYSEVRKGATFTVTLPLKQANVKADEMKTKETEATDKEFNATSTATDDSTKDRLSILIVDDNEEMLQFLSENFASSYTVYTATDGKKALEVLQQHDISLIISDWMMPVMDGMELCKAVRANQLISHIPFILLTAKTDTLSKIEGADGGVDLFMEKPFSLQYLNACIRNLMEQRRLLWEKFSQMPLMPLKSIAGNTTDERLLTQLNKLIEENFNNKDLNVDFLTDKLGISRSGLFAKVKALTNSTPNELIRVVRLKKAAALLAERRYRVSEVCYMVGFENLSYFGKCFQKQFGMQPSKFMEDEQEKK